MQEKKSHTLKNQLDTLNVSRDIDKTKIVNAILGSINQSNYALHEVDDQRPWGAFFRLKNENANEFIEEFFPDLDASEIRLGNDDIELSPKILLVSPDQRLSWQYHNLRAECWKFLTKGAYSSSETDEQGEVIKAESGEFVQHQRYTRHRLIGHTAYTLVAEIWQHSDSENPSSEIDIIRLDDDYSR